MSHVVERMGVKKHQDFTDTKSTKGVAPFAFNRPEALNALRPQALFEPPGASLDRRAPDLGNSPRVP